MQIAQIAVMARSGTDLEQTIEKLPKDWQSRIHVLSCPILDISATQIRTRIREGRSIRHLVPDSVLQTINELRLYS